LNDAPDDDILADNPMASAPSRNGLSMVGLFSGIGGLESGFAAAGFHSHLLCEIDAGARAVLARRFSSPVHDDVRTLRALPQADVVAAGFPCQDLSQAGRTAGIRGSNSGLVEEVFRLLRRARRSSRPTWLVLENVPFMLQLQRGRAMRYLVDELEELGFTWAYRVVDARSFGLPQRRQRVLLVASRTEDPRPVLFGVDADETHAEFNNDRLCGFYWTEGSRGLGWAVDAIPTLKGGSTIGIPSPPAIWDPQDGSISTPEIRDAERLQGFETDWTAAALDAPGVKRGHRWKLVGNAVSVPVAAWLAERILRSSGGTPAFVPLKRGVAWPRAAWGHKGQVYSVAVSRWPVALPSTSLRAFLRFERTPLSHRAAAGFLSRAEQSALRFEENFLRDVSRHVRRMSKLAAA
jgi:DNA (cytosine-5)-methyltransferase 1